GGVLVEHNVRRPTTSGGCWPAFCWLPSAIVNTCRATRCAVSGGSRRDVLWRGVDPAGINVDCAGPVREDVPSHGLLSEGLTGEHHWFVAWLQRRAPAIPLLSRIGSGSSDVASFRTGKNRIAAGRIVRAIP